MKDIEMKVFIGSTTEASATLLIEVAETVTEEGITPIKWNAPGVLPTGMNFLESLNLVRRRFMRR